MVDGGDCEPVGYASPPPLGRSRPRLAGSLLGVVIGVLSLVALAAAAWLLPPRGAVGPAAPEASTGSPAGGPDAVLAARAAALLRHDRAGWLASVDDGARAGQAAEFDRVDGLPVVAWRYRVTALARGVSPARGGDASSTAARPSDARPSDAHPSTATVELTYRLAGDTRDVVRTRTVGFLSGNGPWRLVSDRPATDADRDLWDLGPMTVARGSRGVAVTPAGAPSAAPDLARRVDAATQAVDDVWGPSWPRPVVVVLPADLDQMAAALDRADPRGLDRLSAVTTGRLDRGRTGAQAVAGAADRVVLNPVVWRRLTDAGRLVVLTHELAHVATRATTSATPPAWLDEGFATYVGYRGSGLTDVGIAADALPPVRAGRLPAALPPDEAFDPAHGDPDPAYAQAWVACDLVVRRAGLPGLAAVYRRAASGTGGEQGADAALLQVLHEHSDTFFVQWRERLTVLARAGG